MKLDIAVCDDIKADLDFIADCLKGVCADMDITAHIDLFSSGEAFLSAAVTAALILGLSVVNAAAGTYFIAAMSYDNSLYIALNTVFFAVLFRASCGIYTP